MHESAKVYQIVASGSITPLLLRYGNTSSLWSKKKTEQRLNEQGERTTISIIPISMCYYSGLYNAITIYRGQFIRVKYLDRREVRSYTLWFINAKSFTFYNV